jgi:outer membrane protein, heavy metal efflux system
MARRVLSKTVPTAGTGESMGRTASKTGCFSRRYQVSLLPRGGHALVPAPLLLMVLIIAALVPPSLAAQGTEESPAASAATVPPLPTPSAMPGVDSLLKDPAALRAWMEQRNPDLLAAGARVRQADADVAQQRLYPNPDLGAVLGGVPVGETNPPGLASGETHVLTTTLSETVEIGKRGPRISSARYRLDAERESYRDLLARKTAEARYALARVVYLNSRHAALEESLSAAKENVELQRARFTNGDLSGNDFDRLKVDTAILESEVAGTLQDFEEAAASCGALLAASCDALGGSLGILGDAAPVPDAPDVEAALESRPDLKAMGFDRDAARQDALLSRRRRIPDPNFSVAYVHDNLVIAGDQPRTLEFGVTFPLPLFDRGQHDAEKAEQRAVEIDRGALAERERGKAELKSLLRRKESLEMILRSLNAEAVPTSKGVLDSTLTAVNRGGMSMTDLLLARRTHTDLELKVMDLEFDLFSVRNDLRRALGLDLAAERPAPGA